MNDKISKFGIEIRKIRENKHFSVRQSALQGGISSSYWSQVENGKRNIPKPATLEKIARGLSTDKDVIFKLAGLTINSKNDSKPTEVDLKESIDDDKTIMTFEGRPIPPEDLEYILRILNGGKDDE
ncbi:XRE family transcriptional regulator [Lactobacillus brevis KB290] [Lactiplantibacillus mudanjiangensis]|uniref:helix-turn-helix domain-containing protein n=1 Tax=Lactiplantibacillus mudanjiangensis TaxID=1296538 RepID=UPI00101560AC|nr:XRE family transcriptional regulator [Lactobacillus brevis KB290] [Lactiplantibacillus mudanjiangensis]